MKYILITLMSLTAISCAKSNSDGTISDSDAFIGQAVPQSEIATSEDGEIQETDSHVFSPEEEELFFNQQSQGQEKATSFKFAQTTWKECSDVVTGNYYGYKCANSRKISSILKSFMDKHLYKCVNAGLAAQGGGTVDDIHIVHAGIFGDPRHSPRSMHAENRAVDIKSLEVKLTNGSVKTLVYEGTKNRKFYTAFRKCWGGIVRDYNQCPLYKGNAGLTGSIGWENKDHQHHMHTSVPYCIKGKYGAYYYQK
jgi:hypothetical protein